MKLNTQNLKFAPKNIVRNLPMNSKATSQGHLKSNEIQGHVSRSFANQ